MRLFNGQWIKNHRHDPLFIGLVLYSIVVITIVCYDSYWRGTTDEIRSEMISVAFSVQEKPYKRIAMELPKEDNYK